MTASRASWLLIGLGLLLLIVSWPLSTTYVVRCGSNDTTQIHRCVTDAASLIDRAASPAGVVAGVGAALLVAGIAVRFVPHLLGARSVDEKRAELEARRALRRP